MTGKNRRILIVSPDYPPDSGGVSMAALELTRGFSSLGYKVMVLTRLQRRHQGLDTDNEENVVRLPHDIKYSEFTQVILKVISEFSPDCAILNGKDIQFVPDVSTYISSHFQIPIVYRPHGAATALSVYFRWNKPPFFGIKSWLLSFYLIRKWIITCSSFSQIVFLGSQRGIFKNFDRFLASRWKLQNISTIPNTFKSILTKKTLFRQKYHIEGCLFINIGNFAPVKNQIQAVRAIRNSSIENSIFVFIGPERNEYAIRTEKQAEGDPRFRFLYDIPRQDVLEAQNASDCCFLYSTSEQQPLVLLEAMSCHKPWICTNVGSVSELAGGIVLKRRCAKYLIEAILKMQVSTIRNKLAQEGFNQWKDYFSPEAVYPKWDRLLSEIINRNPISSGLSRSSRLVDNSL